MTHRRGCTVSLLVAVLLPALGWLLVPAGPVSVTVPSDVTLWAGAYHIHTTRSDGSGTPDEVAAAAARAGLQFVILTDHGDGTRPPLAPAYHSGVLVIDGVEISTSAGHYVALGLPQAPYPLGGEARDVADDVHHLGGIGILAHPDSARSSLAWHDPGTRGDGLEFLNADSAWRDESPFTLLRLLPAYPWHPARALSTMLSYPDGLLRMLDEPVRGSPRLALAAVDAHASMGLRPGDEPMEIASTVARLPSYDASFGTFGLVMPWPTTDVPTGDAARDARALLDGLRAGHVHSAVFTLGGPAPLVFTATHEEGVTLPGSCTEVPGRVVLRVEPPPVPPATLRLLRNGERWTDRSDGQALIAEVKGTDPPAVYRAEVWLPRRWRQPAIPWMVSQAIAVRTPPAPVEGVGRDTDVGKTDGTAVASAWHSEHDATSRVTIDLDDEGRVGVRAALGGGPRASQFGAAVVDWPAHVEAAADLLFTAWAEGPMRVSVQVRDPTDPEGSRWVRSVYLDDTRRAVRVALDDMTPVAPAAGRPPVDRLHAILFVVDTVNARPGDSRAFTIESLRVR